VAARILISMGGMLNHEHQQESDVNGRRRTPTRLSAMGSMTLLARHIRDVPIETADRLPRKVVIGSQALHRSDITEGKLGIPLMLTLSIVDEENGAAPIAGAAVEIWHCDADGVYSEYASKMEPEAATTTYLRGAQTTDSAGRVTFRTIYPGWSGARAAHVCLRIYDGTTARKTAQLGFPDRVNAAVHGDADRYVKGPNPTVNAADPVFGAAPHGGGERGDFSIVPVAGDNTNGYVAMLEIAVRGRHTPSRR
jgi:protocatechuate 3,4-dioxygenase beta subunit